MPVFGKDESTDLVQHNVGHFGFSAVDLDDLLASEYTLVGIAQDVSSSVSGFERDMEKALKAIVEACQDSPRADNLMLRLTTFDSSIDETHGFKMLNQLALDDYDNILNPGGMTALFDASVDIIESVANYGKSLMDAEYNANGIVFVVTDGWKTAGVKSPAQVKEALTQCLRKENLESVVSVLIGVNAGEYAQSLDDYHKECGFTQYVDLKDASPKTLAKLAEFVSKSISSQSSQLGSGQASVPIDPNSVGF